MLTLLLEGAVALLWGLRGRNLALCGLLNVLTNPVVVLLHALVSHPAATALLELSAAAVEGAGYARLGEGIRRPWLLSLAANGFSFFTGLLLNRIF